MFCYQCEQTAKGEACTKSGVCGKQPDVAVLQDLLVHTLAELSHCAVAGRKVGVVDQAVHAFTLEALFSTLTNVDFDADRFVVLIRRCVELRDALREKVLAAGGRVEFQGGSPLKLETTKEGLVKQGEIASLEARPGADLDVRSLQHTLLFGLKGVAAYAYHALILGHEDQKVYDFIDDALDALLVDNMSMGDWLAMVLKCGEINLRTMELLDLANTGAYGHPVPTVVPLGAKKGKAILVSGHDLKDLEDILVQTEGKGIYVYTHGEMLPAHGYPGLKKYAHFYGHYGTAWQNQQKEFAEFPGAILMTTNCIQRPQEGYKDNIFTAGTVGWPGVRHIAGRDFSQVIERALSLPGFERDRNGASVTVGFARQAILGVADKVIEAVKAGKIRHFFLVAGCDGAKPGRNYYTEFVEKLPRDTVVLTLACGKFRFFDKSLGDIEGIPRLLDVGQCNDAYSAIQVAVALAQAFNVGVNELPLSMILSWYEQKAVAILLTLLYLGIKNMRLGPSLPAFITPNILKVLVEKYDIKPITTPEEDIKAVLG
ncbi:hydroxylamine reductase [Syntrophorhabdus aromaticivorans]|uniref:Hydroxylamine reductase n=1 Tax=Syntrophorhabdus aromaticivorans TaxID=328301 RepID=A0A971M6J1_9BACT|nr:hydroxylamine reductase [Syntrophorhabdus aromaticivorans]NLW36412.1 hydroxylamine reductase [Syntrophorhabdus aromaticivorans]